MPFLEQGCRICSTDRGFEVIFCLFLKMRDNDLNEQANDEEINEINNKRVLYYANHVKIK